MKHPTALGFVRLALVASACAVVFTIPVAPTKAQTPLGGDSAPVCMTKGGADTSSLNIVLPDSDSKAMRALGFEEVPCGKAFGSPQEIIEWRDRACAMAANSDERLQELIESKFGARPAVFCGMAELAVGQWRQPSSQGN